MNTNLGKLRTVSLIACLGTLMSAPRLSSQTNVGLQIQFYAGLSITGAVGSVHSVQYATNLAQPAWNFLAVVQLTNNPHRHVDASVDVREQRFYRTVRVEPASFDELQLLPVLEQRAFRTARGLPELVWIVPGTFLLGSPAGEAGRVADEGPQTLVTLTRGFYMGKYEVTQAEYSVVIGVNSSSFPSNPNLPMEMVSWTEATTFCAKLNQREALAGRLPAGLRYRLPTEAEWEYACRAGTTTRYSFGDDVSGTVLGQHAWFNEPDTGRTRPVGTKLPNPWGLYDMHGNVWELCQDAFTYSGGSVTNPVGGGSARMSRGGSWHSLAPRCRSATRNPYNTTGREPWVGFRIVLAPTPP